MRLADFQDARALLDPGDGQNDRAGFERVIPDVGVLGFAQAHFPDGLSIVSGLAQPATAGGS
jgi:hypothetical protein